MYNTSFKFVLPLNNFYFELYRIPGSEWALQQAKRNVLEKYILVGVTEKMSEFLQMLELVIPGGMFRNASEHFKHSMYKRISVY